VSEEALPVIVTVAETGELPLAAEKVRVAGVPGVNVMGCGETVTPVGSPPIWTAIEPLKPFSAVALSEAVLVPPAGSEIVGGLTLIVKSGLGGGGGGGGGAVVPPPPPQAASKLVTQNRKVHRSGFHLPERTEWREMRME